jgi:pimeloyl-ACP methyl ester carboxylesterase
MGDPVFDQFYASQVAYVGSPVETELHVQQAGAALLDRIGPAILVTHSQAGTFGWLLADARPALVKGIVAIEPSGPPIKGSPNSSTGMSLPWGVTDISITYDPPISSPSELAVEQQPLPDGPDLQACWLQKAPARRLPRLGGIPVLIMSTEASYHAAYDHCISRYLAQSSAHKTPT